MSREKGREEIRVERGEGLTDSTEVSVNLFRSLVGLEMGGIKMKD